MFSCLKTVTTTPWLNDLDSYLHRWIQCVLSSWRCCNRTAIQILVFPSLLTASLLWSRDTTYRRACSFSPAFCGARPSVAPSPIIIIISQEKANPLVLICFWPRLLISELGWMTFFVNRMFCTHQFVHIMMMSVSAAALTQASRISQYS